MAKNDKGKSKADQYREERKARLAKASKKTASQTEKLSKVQKIVQKIISIVIILAILSGISWQIMGFTGIIPIMTTAMTVGSEKISVRDYNYYYVLMYNYTKNQSDQYQQQYGQNVMGFDSTISPDEQDYPQKDAAGNTITWATYLDTSAIDRAQQYAVLYTEALNAKYKLTAAEQKTIDDQIEQIRATAAKQNMSLDSYLREFYGKGITEKFLKAQLGKETIVARFSTDKNDAFKKACTDSVISKIYNADKSAYDVVNLRAFSFPITALTANTNESADDLAARQKTANAAVKAKVDAMLAAINGEASFISLSKTNKPVVKGVAYDPDGETANFYKSKSTIESSVSADAATWAFDAKRAAGDKSVFATDTAYFVVWIKTPQFPSATVDVRHILISFKADTSDTTAATTEEIAAAKNKADAVYAEWKKGKKTQASFAALAKAKSTDTGSKDKGGLYEKVAVASMVAPFENWSFDPIRKPGDTGIVKTTYGYHIMYFVKANKTDFTYKTTIRDDKATKDNDAYVKALLADKKYKLTKNNANITKAKASSLKIINTLITLSNKSAAAQQTAS